MTRESLRRHFHKTPPRSILVVRTDRVGDLILSTPFLQALREGFPKARVTCWVPSYCESVLAESGLVDRIVTSRPEEEFDLAVALAPRSECLKQVAASRAPVRAGYVYQDRPLVKVLARRCLTHMETVVVEPPARADHEVEHLDRVARLLGLPSSTKFKLDVGMRFQTHDWLVLHLGDRWFANGWAMDDIARLCYGLEGFGRLVVTAGPREADLVRDGELGEFDLRTGLRFKEWCALIGGARVLVSPDTGAVHVAAALVTPVVVAYEESTYEHCSAQWRPWRVEHRQVVKSAPEGTVERILENVRGLIEGTRFAP